MSPIWFFIIFCLKCEYSMLINHVTLTPTNSNQQGAFVAILDSYDVTTTTTSWDIVIKDQISFQMLINLSSMWGFHPTYISKLTLTINSSMQVSSINDCDLYIAWSDISNTQFFTTIFRMDKNENKKQNLISPWCDTTTPPTTSMNYANINSLVMNDPGNLDLSTKATNGGLKADMQPAQLCPAYPESWPLTIQLENDPVNNIIYITHYNPVWGAFKQTCGFLNTFVPSQGFQIYINIGGDDTEEVYNITSFTLNLETDFSTNDPTLNPTYVPTNNVSYSETNNTRSMPSNYYSNNPTKSPTKTLSGSRSNSQSTLLFKWTKFGDKTIIIALVILGIVTVCVFCLIYKMKHKMYMNRDRYRCRESSLSDIIEERKIHDIVYVLPLKNGSIDVNQDMNVEIDRRDSEFPVMIDCDDRIAQQSLLLLQQQIIKMGRVQVDMSDTKSNSELEFCSVKAECSGNSRANTNVISIISPLCLGGFTVSTLSINNSRYSIQQKRMI